MAGKEATWPVPDALVSLQAGTPFVVVSYFTGEYARLAAQLAAHCRMAKVDFYITRIRSRGSWLENVRHRPAFLLSIFPTTLKDLVWVDADGTIKSFPLLFSGLSGSDYELAVHRNSKGRYRVGTMWFANTERGRDFVIHWAAVVRTMPGKTEQEVLNAILLRPGHGWKVLDLPATYCSIFDKATDKAAGPAVVEHFQASRRLRRLVR